MSTSRVRIVRFAGPLLCAYTTGVMFGVVEAGSVWQIIGSLAEFVWELSLGIYPIVKGFRPSALIVKGFRPSALIAMDAAPAPAGA